MKQKILLVFLLAGLLFFCGCTEKKPTGADFSCKKDSDCAIKVTGCNCAGEIRSCVNKNSISTDCTSAMDFFKTKCQMEQIVPMYCQCESGQCNDIFVVEQSGN